jgi:hypothetical protein
MSEEIYDPNGDLEKPPPCKNCGHQKDMKGEPDGCLGFLAGVVDACCGHGDKENSYVHFQDGTVLEGFVKTENAGDGDSIPLWIMNPVAIDNDGSLSEVESLRQSLADARAEVERLKCCGNCANHTTFDWSHETRCEATDYPVEDCLEINKKHWKSEEGGD